MPAALLRLLPLLLGFLAQAGAGKGVKALQGVSGLGKVPGASRALGFLGRHPMATGLGAFFGTEMTASSLLGLNAESERVSGNDGNLTGLLQGQPPGSTSNEAGLQALMQDEELMRMMGQMGQGGGVF